MNIKLLLLILSIVLLGLACKNIGVSKFHYAEDEIEIKLILEECVECPMDSDYKKTIKVNYRGNNVKHIVELSQERDLGIHFGQSKINSELKLKGVNQVIVIRDFYEGCKILDVERNENISDDYLKSISQYECDSLFEKINNQIDFETFIFFNGKRFYEYSGEFIEEKKRNGTF